MLISDEDTASHRAVRLETEIVSTKQSYHKDDSMLHTKVSVPFVRRKDLSPGSDRVHWEGRRERGFFVQFQGRQKEG